MFNKYNPSKLIVLLGAMCFSASAVGAYSQPDGFSSWRSDELGITLNYPLNWKVDEKPETVDVPCLLEADVTIGLDDPDQADPFGAFVMPVFIGEGYFEDITTLADVWRQNSKRDWVEFEIISQGEVATAEGHPGYELRYAVTDEMDYRIQWSVWLVLTKEKKRAWVLGYCARDAFNTYYQDARNIFGLAEFDD